MTDSNVDGITVALRNIHKKLDNLTRRGISVRYEDLSTLMKVEGELRDIVEMDGDRVVSASLYPLFTDLVDPKEFAFEVLGLRRSPYFIKPSFSENLADHLRADLGLEIDTRLNGYDFNPGQLDWLFNLYIEGDTGDLDRNYLLTRFYKRDQEAFDALSREFDEKTIELFGATYTYGHFMRILEVIERSRLTFYNYRKFMIQAKQKRDEDPDFDIYLRLGHSIEAAMTQIPCFLETDLIRKEGAKRSGLDELLELHRAAKQRKFEEPSNPDAVVEYEMVLHKIVDWCFDDFFNNEYTPLEEFAARYSMKNDQNFFDRLQRINRAGEINMYDIGPLSVSIDVLRNESIDLKGVGDSADERLVLVHQFNDDYLSGLQHHTGNSKLEDVEDFIPAFKQGDLQGFEAQFLTGSESARRLFRLSAVPSVVGDDKGSLAGFIADRSKRYGASSRLRVLDPFSLQGDSKGYYVASDLAPAPTEEDTTVRSQIDGVEGLYSGIKAELILREVVATSGPAENLYTLEQAVAELGCREYFFRKLVDEHEIDYENPVLVRAHNTIVEAGDLEGFDNYEGLVAFYDEHFKRDRELSRVVESSRGYDKVRIDDLKSLFIGSEEVGRIMGFDFAVSDELIKRVRGERKRPYLPVRSTNGEAKYYRPEVENLVARFREDGTLRDLFIYHAVEQEFSSRRDR